MKRGSGTTIAEEEWHDFEEGDDFEEWHAIAEESPDEADLDASVGEARVDASSNGAGASVGAGASTTASAFARPRLPISTEPELREKLAADVKDVVFSGQLDADPRRYDCATWRLRALVERKLGALGHCDRRMSDACASVVAAQRKEANARKALAVPGLGSSDRDLEKVAVAKQALAVAVDCVAAKVAVVSAKECLWRDAPKALAASVSLLLQESRALGLDLESHEDDARYIFVAHVHDGGQCAAALARQGLESADLLGALLVLVNGEATWALTPDVLQRTLARQRPLDLRLELELPPRSPRRESTPQQPLPLPASLAFAPALPPYGYPPAPYGYPPAPYGYPPAPYGHLPYGPPR